MSYLLSIPKELFALINQFLDYDAAKMLNIASKDLALMVNIFDTVPEPKVTKIGEYTRAVTPNPYSGNVTITETFGKLLHIERSAAKLVITYKKKTYIAGPVTRKRNKSEDRDTPDDFIAINRFKNCGKRSVEYYGKEHDWPVIVATYSRNKVKVAVDDRVVFVAKN
ncbi:hypothetical protein BNJ_00417 [Kaumoebavirus]|uniref:hypothetical protein n=1 Tax=Kaumoebavirus TaxID=1859492 RepID=UPI0009C2D667|nr:hypothetical protein BNJ_00417 [Kaumoebavirus]ARA72232.1 hypothetical protein BNJ_00417 [Kaumoebavirus]